MIKPLDLITGRPMPFLATPVGLLTLRPALIPYPAKPEIPGLFPDRLASGWRGETRCCVWGVAEIPFDWIPRPIR